MTGRSTTFDNNSSGTVFDPTMFARQALQLEQEARAVIEQAQIMKSLVTGGMGGMFRDPNALLGQLGSIIDQNEGLSYSTGNVTRQFAMLYPGTNVVGGAQTPWVSVQQTLNTLQGVLASVEAAHQDFRYEDAALMELRGRNAMLTGGLQAQQVANDIALHQAREMQLARQLQLAANDAESTAEAARMQSEIATQNQATVLGNMKVPGDLADPASYAPPQPLPGLP